ncbi:hypothetical protein ACLOJK_035157 [Asimina triloba]
MCIIFSAPSEHQFWCSMFFVGLSVVGSPVSNPSADLTRSKARRQHGDHDFSIFPIVRLAIHPKPNGGNVYSISFPNNDRRRSIFLADPISSDKPILPMAVYFVDGNSSAVRTAACLHHFSARSSRSELSIRQPEPN